MLKIKRGLNEVVCIGPSVQVKVIDMTGGVVTLGIRAPRRLDIDRLEERQRQLEGDDGEDEYDDEEDD